MRLVNRVKSKSHCHDVATTKVDSDSVDGTHFDINYEESKNDVSVSPMYTLSYLYLMYEYSIVMYEYSIVMYEYSIVQQLLMMMRGVLREHVIVG